LVELITSLGRAAHIFSHLSTPSRLALLPAYGFLDPSVQLNGCLYEITYAFFKCTAKIRAHASLPPFGATPRILDFVQVFGR